MNDAIAESLSVFERVAPGQTHGETKSVLGRGALVFFGGMMLAAVSFVVEDAIVRTLKAS